ncbi:hypothetical protein TNCV_4280651 [Trichonephila clavipes]|nr:hypothetical protein TNCV_4280651 [Trichonephila clavipes]
MGLHELRLRRSYLMRWSSPKCRADEEKWTRPGCLKRLANRGETDRDKREREKEKRARKSKREGLVVLGSGEEPPQFMPRGDADPGNPETRN